MGTKSIKEVKNCSRTNCTVIFYTNCTVVFCTNCTVVYIPSIMFIVLHINIEFSSDWDLTLLHPGYFIPGRCRGGADSAPPA